MLFVCFRVHHTLRAASRQRQQYCFLTAVAMTHTPTAAELEFEGLKSGEQRVAIVTGASSGWLILYLAGVCD